jgi:hypothetical protein
MPKKLNQCLLDLNFPEPLRNQIVGYVNEFDEQIKDFMSRKNELSET